MVFKTLELIDDSSVLKATAEGHATDVIQVFFEIANIIFQGQGPWRIFYVNGVAFDEDRFDSSMKWTLAAKLKRE